jgi:ferrous-iron efflux pump FieF
VALAVMALSCVGSASIVAIQAWTLRRVQSLAIQADSLHYKGDLLANVVVIVAILVTQEAGLAWFDPVAGAVIAGYLFFASVAIMRRSTDQLMDRELPGEARDRIAAIVHADPDARGFHDLRTRSLGLGAHIELHLELDGHLDLFEAHEITDRVELAIQGAFARSQVTIHTEPHGLDDERLDDLVQPAG